MGTPWRTAGRRAGRGHLRGEEGSQCAQAACLYVSKQEKNVLATNCPSSCISTRSLEICTKPWPGLHPVTQPLTPPPVPSQEQLPTLQTQGPSPCKHPSTQATPKPPPRQQPSEPPAQSPAPPAPQLSSTQIWEANWTMKLSREESRSLETAGIYKREIFAFKTFKLYMAGPGPGRGGGGRRGVFGPSRGQRLLGEALGRLVLDLCHQ